MDSLAAAARRVGAWIIAATSATATLAACGGGGGGSGGGPPPAPVDPPDAAVLSLEVGLKQLQFGWEVVDGATSYRLLANPDGASGFTQLGDDIPAGDTAAGVDVSVHLHDWGNARYLLDACNAGGCTGSNEIGTIGGALEAIGYFKTSNHEAGDNLDGVALSADGMTLAFGAPGEDSAATGIDGTQDDNSAASSGAVYVFRRVDGEWTQQAYVKASNAEAGDGFGASVALSADGRTLAVGAPTEDSGATGADGDQDDNSVASSGAVYVFVQDDAGTWTQQAYVKASNPDPGDAFGWELALSGDGDTLAAGAQFESSAAIGVHGDETDNSAPSAGAVYLFRRDAAGAWSQRVYVKASNTETIDHFGDSVALDGDGNVLAVGATLEDSAATGIDGDFTDNSANAAGAVYIYVGDHESDIWHFLDYVKAPNTGANDQFGGNVALDDDGRTLAVSAAQEDSAATGVDGDQADDSVGNAGAVYVYGRNGASWAFQSYLKASNPDIGDLLGFGLSLSGDGNTIAVSSGGEDGGSSGVGGNESDNNVDTAGAVYVFQRDAAESAWSQRAYVKAPNPDDGDRFGSRVALSEDGGTLAVLSRTEESAATGIGGNQNDNTAPFAGAVWLY